MKTKTILIALALSVPVIALIAQDRPQRPPGQQGQRPPQFQGGPQDGQPPQPGQGGQRGPGQGQPGQRPPVPPLMAALDANHDGVIDAAEIDNAAAALRALDKNRDGKLTQEELRPIRPRGDGPGNGPGNRPEAGPGFGGPGGSGDPGPGGPDRPRRPRGDMPPQGEPGQE